MGGRNIINFRFPSSGQIYLVRLKSFLLKIHESQIYALCSASQALLTPLYSAQAISASEIQNLALGERSMVPSSPMGVCSPPVPRTWRPKGSQISLAFLSVPSK